MPVRVCAGTRDLRVQHSDGFKGGCKTSPQRSALSGVRVHLCGLNFHEEPATVQKREAQSLLRQRRDFLICALNLFLGKARL